MTAPEKSWVWYSDKQSRAAGKLSVLAVVETTVAVAFYWWLAFRIDTAFMLVVSPIVAFLVLLRSPESIAEGVRLVDSYIELTDVSYRRFILSYILSICLAGVLSYQMVSFYRPETVCCISYQHALSIGMAATLISGLVTVNIMALHDVGDRILTLPIPGFFSCFCLFIYLDVGIEAIVIITFMLGVSSFAATAHSLELRNGLLIKFLNAVLFVVLIPSYLGLVGGIVLRVFLIRCYATSRFLFLGVSNFPRNWSRLNLIQDFCTPPDFVPGLSDDHHLSFSGFRRHNSSSLTDLFVWLMVFPFVFLPAILYRVTLKSTAWLYLPVIWMAHIPAKLRDDDRKEVWIKSDGRGLFTLLSAISVLAYALYIAFDPTAFAAMRAANESQMLTPAHLIWAIDPAGWKLWFWVTLPSSALTIIVWVWVNKIRNNLAVGGQLDWHSGQIRALIALNQIKNALIIAWMLMTLLSVARAGWILGKLPASMEPIFQNFVLPITNMWSS